MAKLAVLFLAALTLLTGAARAQDLFPLQQIAYYVSTSGSDSNAGTLAAPFATLGKCQTAMQGSGIKTCFIRAGSYSPASVGACNVWGGGAVALNLTSSDAGETFSYYPPDGYNTAVFDGGGSAGTSNGLSQMICATGGGASAVTINGLTLQNVYGGEFYSQAQLTVINNVLNGEFQESFPNDYACLLVNNGAGSVFKNNVFENCYDRGLDIEEITNGGSNNITIANNFFYNTCTHGGDCGAIYFGDGASTTSTGVTISNNFIRDVNAVNNSQPGSGENVGFCVYLDSTTNSKSITGNVCTGKVGFANPPGGGGNACFFIHAGSSNTYTGNICDLQGNTSLEIANGQSGSANVFNENVIVANQAQTAGVGYAGFSTSQFSINGNQYYNFNTSYTVATSGGGGSDSNPVQGNPLLHCWGAILGASSPAFNSPVNFPAQPTGWDTPGFWGPPGFTMPHTGTAPSWSTSSGDGVTCTGSN